MTIECNGFSVVADTLIRVKAGGDIMHLDGCGHTLCIYLMVNKSKK
jgi:hypothetical protein